jgi:hypothetical protein
MMVMTRGNYNAEEWKNTVKVEKNSTSKRIFPSFTVCFLSDVLESFIYPHNKIIFMPNDRRVMNDTAHVQ